MLIRRETVKEEGRICWNSPGKKVHKSEVLLAGNNVLITESIARLTPRFWTLPKEYISWFCFGGI